MFNREIIHHGQFLYEVINQAKDSYFISGSGIEYAKEILKCELCVKRPNTEYLLFCRKIEDAIIIHE